MPQGAGVAGAASCDDVVAKTDRHVGDGVK